ncbi:MAG TPA: extradiol dioxygenase [Terriglobales bacterium]
MIIGTHIVMYSKQAEADRAFFRDILKLHTVDVGHGWLIFRLPPAEAACHPIDQGAQEANEEKHMAADLYFLCDDLHATIADLQANKIACTAVDEQRWGLRTSIVLPSGARIGLYQPKHQLAIEP